MHQSKFLMLLFFATLGSALSAQTLVVATAQSDLPEIKTIELSIINETDDEEPAGFAIRQANLIPNANAVPTFWHSYTSLDPGQKYSFKYDYELAVCGTDYRNHGSRWVHEVRGKKVSYVNDRGTKKVIVTGNASNPNQIEFTNAMKEEIGGVSVYRDNLCLTKIRSIRPYQTVTLEFEEKILIGHTPGWNGYTRVTQEMVDAVNTELDLTGIISADIVVRGGGGEPYTYHLENVERLETDERE